MPVHRVAHRLVVGQLALVLLDDRGVVVRRRDHVEVANAVTRRQQLVDDVRTR